MTEKELREMKLHEAKEIASTKEGAWIVFRVPNGWVYAAGIGVALSAVFVPEPVGYNTGLFGYDAYKNLAFSKDVSGVVGYPAPLSHQKKPLDKPDK